MEPSRGDPPRGLVKIPATRFLGQAGSVAGRAKFVTQCHKSIVLGFRLADRWAPAPPGCRSSGLSTARLLVVSRHARITRWLAGRRLSRQPSSFDHLAMRSLLLVLAVAFLAGPVALSADPVVEADAQKQIAMLRGEVAKLKAENARLAKALADNGNVLTDSYQSVSDILNKLPSDIRSAEGRIAS